jgi:FKBP-type peptidyl-prolyl cis-trans isomerase
MLAVAAAALIAAACAKTGDQAPAAGELTTDAQKFGYAIGVDLGKSLKQVEGDVDVAALKTGLDEALSGKEPRLNDKERQEIKTTVAKKIQAKQLEERTAKAAKAKEEGEKFLAENAKKAGVKTTASGLQYEALQEGSGDSPTKDDQVTVQYKGTLINGEVFDSSYERNKPVTFPLGNVIPGWTEGLQLMKPGAKYKLYIPSTLGYGERGAGAKIGPNETLIFEVELVAVEKGAAKAVEGKKLPAPKLKQADPKTGAALPKKAEPAEAPKP